MALCSTRIVRVCAVMCVASLIAATPVMADPWDATPPATTTAPSDTTAPSTTPPSTPAPSTSPAPSPSTPKKPSPAKPNSPAPSNNPAPTNDTARKTPAEPSSLPVPVDPKTEQFRQELADKQARLDAFKAQLDELDRQLSIAVEAYNQAAARLAMVRGSLETNQTDLTNAQHAYDTQARLLRDRANAMYRNGDTDALEIILGAKSVPDFLSRLQFLGVIGQKDAEVALRLAEQRDAVQRTMTDLKQARIEAEALEFDMRARKIEIENRIAEQQALLQGTQGDLLQLLQGESTRRNADEAALMRQILLGASQAGVTVQQGSPVETALAYHGIPYLWGGETPAAFDCSGLVLYVFKQHGVRLPHYSGAQFQLGEKIAAADMQAGDAVFFGSPIHHVGIYLGGGYYIHAPKTGDFVKVSRLADRRDFAGARRYAWVPRLTPIAGLDQIDQSRVNPNAPGLPR